MLLNIFEEGGQLPKFTICSELNKRAKSLGYNFPLEAVVEYVDDRIRDRTLTETAEGYNLV